MNPRPPSAGTDTEGERVYDAYLAACLAGKAEAPVAVFERHASLSEDVRERIRLLHATFCETPPPGAPRARLAFGPYRLLRELGRGGMGAVHLAEDTRSGTLVAVKRLHSEHTSSARAVERLRREAMAVARLDDPHIVRLLDAGEIDGTPYLVTEYVPGRSLRSLVEEAAAAGRPLSLERAMTWGTQVASALEAAHAAGIVHRDVKPSNVLIDASDTARLVDFGVARLPDITAGGLTTSFAGTPTYAAPEQFAGADVDARADVYGLAATLLEVCIGKPPFGGRTVEEVVRTVLTAEAPRLRAVRPDAPASLERVLTRGLEKEPTDRPPTVAAFREDLERVLRGERDATRALPLHRRARKWARRNRTLAAAIPAAVLVATVGGGLWVAGELSAAEERRAEAARLLDVARELVRQGEERGETLRERRERVAALRVGLLEGYVPKEQLESLDREERALREDEAAQQTFELDVLETLRVAERLDVDLAGTDAVRARLYVERWRDAVGSGDLGGIELYGELARTLDPNGEVGPPGLAGVPVQFGRSGLPAGTQVHGFRYVALGDVDPTGGPRWVPASLDGDALPHAGEHCLLVEADDGELRAADLVTRLEGEPVHGSVFVWESSTEQLWRLVSIDGAPVSRPLDARMRLTADTPRALELRRRGVERSERAGAELDLQVVPAERAAGLGGVRATLLANGSERAVELPAALRVRSTMAPAPCSASSLLHPRDGPLEALTAGHYLFVVRAPGHDVLLRAQFMRGGGNTIDVDLSPIRSGTGPTGFVHIAPPRHLAAPFWIQRFEVTCAQYAEFLRALPLEEAASRAPRHDPEPTRWTRGADDAWAPPSGTSSDEPVLGVSYDDAAAYAAWRSTRAPGQCPGPLIESRVGGSAARRQTVLNAAPVAGELEVGVMCRVVARVARSRTHRRTRLVGAPLAS